jgi:branched-chain amino acid transport system substrate-binding protein
VGGEEPSDHFRSIRGGGALGRSHGGSRGRSGNLPDSQRRRRTWRGWLGGLSVAALVLAGCGSSGQAPSGPAPAGNAPGGAGQPATYEINVILPLTGQGAFLGQPQQQALQVLEGLVNREGGIQGHPVHFTFQDDQSSPQTAVQLANQLIAKKVPVILGSSLVAMCSAMAPLMKDGPVMYCLSPGIHPAAGGYVFSTSVSTTSLAQAAVAYFRSQGWTRLAVLTSTDATGQDADNAIQAALNQPDNAAMRVVAHEHFAPSDVSVAAQITRIKAAQPQALIAWATGTPIGTVFQAIAQAGLDVPVATTNGNQTYAQMQRMASFLPKQLFIPTAQWAAYDALPPGPVKDAQKKYFDAFQALGVKPDNGQSLAWDPALIVIDALRHLGVGATAAQIRAYIAGLKGFAGINGVYDFAAEPQRGLTVQQAVVTRWDPGKSAWVAVSGPAGAPLKQ